MIRRVPAKCTVGVQRGCLVLARPQTTDPTVMDTPVSGYDLIVTLAEKQEASEMNDP